MVKPHIPAQIAPDLLDRLRARFAPFPLIQGWNLSIEAIESGRATLKLGASTVVLNTESVINGGVLATVADMACALALSTAFDGIMPFATADLHIRFLEPAEGILFAEGEILRLSPRSAVLECRLMCEGRIVALCTAHFTIKRWRGGGTS